MACTKYNRKRTHGRERTRGRKRKSHTSMRGGVLKSLKKLLPRKTKLETSCELTHQ